MQATLEQLKHGSAPGIDGIPAEVYQAFREIFVLKPFQMMKVFLHRGEVV